MGHGSESNFFGLFVLSLFASFGEPAFPFGKQYWIGCWSSMILSMAIELAPQIRVKRLVIFLALHREFGVVGVFQTSF